MHLHLLAVHDYALHESVYTACAVTCVQAAMFRLCLLSLRVSVEKAKGHSLCEGRKLHYAKQTDTFRSLFACIICQDCELLREATLLRTQRPAAMTVMVRGGTVPAHLQLSHPRGLAPSALAELVPGWMMVTKSSMAGSGQMAGFKQNPVLSCRGVSSRLAYRRGWRQICWCMQLCCNVACADVCCQCGCLLLAEWQRIAYSSQAHRLNHILAWTVQTIWP